MTFSRLKYSLARLGEQLWFWPAVYALLALCAIGISVASDEVPLPFDLPDISTETLRSLLNVLASTLLGVATFAVASMVAAYTSASTTATPRAFALVIADSMSRRALSVFIAGYIFSIIGLITVHVHTLGTIDGLHHAGQRPLHDLGLVHGDEARVAGHQVELEAELGDARFRAISALSRTQLLLVVADLAARPE